MTIEVKWHTKPHILLVEFLDEVTPEDLIRMEQEYVDLSDPVPNPVYLIVDVTQMKQFEMGWLRQMRQLASKIALNKTPFIVVVGFHLLFNLFMDVVARFSRREVFHALDRTAALHRIVQHNPTSVKSRSNNSVY